jgi:hypothetical protein
LDTRPAPRRRSGCPDCAGRLGRPPSSRRFTLQRFVSLLAARVAGHVAVSLASFLFDAPRPLSSQRRRHRDGCVRPAERRVPCETRHSYDRDSRSGWLTILHPGGLRANAAPPPWPSAGPGLSSTSRFVPAQPGCPDWSGRSSLGLRSPPRSSDHRCPRPVRCAFPHVGTPVRGGSGIPGLLGPPCLAGEPVRHDLGQAERAGISPRRFPRPTPRCRPDSCRSRPGRAGNDVRGRVAARAMWPLAEAGGCRLHRVGAHTVRGALHDPDRARLAASRARETSACAGSRPDPFAPTRNVEAPGSSGREQPDPLGSGAGAAISLSGGRIRKAASRHPSPDAGG